jgi:hypothetical protein
MKRIWLILAAVLGLAATSIPASADIQYTLNCSADPCTGGNAGHNYGSVTLKQLGSGTVADPYHVQVTVALAAGEVFLTTGSHSGFVWNLQGSHTLQSITITSATASLFNNPSLTAGSHADSPFTSGGLGNFEYAISNKNTAGSGGISGSLIFDIKQSGGLLLTDSLFNANAGGYFFVADIGQGCTFSSDKWNCASTGSVASNKRIPEPGTMGLSIVALAGLTGLVMLRRRRQLVRA